MWLIVDTLMLAPFVAIFTILCFLPENIAIVYPICFASIFSSFGCIYLAAYICTSVQTTYRAQALEKQKTYYKDRLQDEERVRQIYHDMKNHLLVLQSQSENSPVLHQAAQTLQDQLQAYESYQHTGNEYLDAIIRDKARLAREKSIDFTSVIHFEAGHFLDPLDISTLFGNALDNAIEACVSEQPEDPTVTVSIRATEDYLLTKQAVEQVQFDNAFIFRYSPRRGTPAAVMENQIPEEVKEARNQDLLAVVNEIAIRKNRDLVGTVQEVLLEGPSKTNAARLSGRTSQNKPVMVDAAPDLAGEILPIRIEESTGFTLYGVPCPSRG